MTPHRAGRRFTSRKEVGESDERSRGRQPYLIGGRPCAARDSLIMAVVLRSCTSSNWARRRADFTVPGVTHTGQVQTEAFWVPGIVRQPSFWATWRTATISLGWMRRGIITS